MGLVEIMIRTGLEKKCRKMGSKMGEQKRDVLIFPPQTGNERFPQDKTNSPPPFFLGAPQEFFGIVF